MLGARSKGGKSVDMIVPRKFYLLGESWLLGCANPKGSDLNPGSSPINSLLTCMHMASSLFRLTPEEVLHGVTKNAARALGLADEVGSLDVGKRADFCLWDLSSPELLCYQLGGLKPLAVYKDGQRVNHEKAAGN